MEPRIDYLERGQDAVKAMFGLNKYLSKSTIEKHLLDLIDYRISQINGCAFCLDMHSKDLVAGGETDQRIFVVSAWREAPFYSERERAALNWAEAVNKYDVPDDVYEAARKQFSEEELIYLTMQINALTCYNRLNIAFRNPAGTYQPGQFSAQPQKAQVN